MAVDTPAATLGDRLAVYEYRSHDGFFVWNLFPRATHIPARLDDTAAKVLDRVPASCQAFLPHLDLSRTHRLPPDRDVLLAELARRGVRVLNRDLDDTRKSSLHRVLAAAGLPVAAATAAGDPDELLIVKTDYNYGGMHERALTGPQREGLGLAAADPGLAGWADYRVLTRGEMLAQWWRDETLVVERFVDNAEGEFFRVCVAGESLSIIRAYSSDQIKKVGAGPRDANFLTRRERLRHLKDNGKLSPRLLETVAQFLERTAVEFGTIDIVHEGGDEFYIIDLNLTPYGTRRQDDLQEVVLDHLRAGLFPAFAARI